jgi:hypothetical protein
LVHLYTTFSRCHGFVAFFSNPRCHLASRAHNEAHAIFTTPMFSCSLNRTSCSISVDPLTGPAVTDFWTAARRRSVTQLLLPSRMTKSLLHRETSDPRLSCTGGLRGKAHRRDDDSAKWTRQCCQKRCPMRSLHTEYIRWHVRQIRHGQASVQKTRIIARFRVNRKALQDMIQCCICERDYRPFAHTAN